MLKVFESGERDCIFSNSDTALSSAFQISYTRCTRVHRPGSIMIIALPMIACMMSYRSVTRMWMICANSDQTKSAGGVGLGFRSERSMCNIAKCEQN